MQHRFFIFFISAFVLVSFFSIPSQASAAPSPYFIPSRTTGVAPLAVFFDTASSTAASTTDIAVTSRPFHDLDYSWSFGDPAGGAVWNYGTASTSKNIAYGPEAAHLFETPGTYTINLTVYNGTQSAATSTTITVTDPGTVFSGTNTICFSTSSTFTGCPSGATQIATTTFNQPIQVYKGANKRLLFRRGETFTSSATGDISAVGPMTIGAYGTGGDYPTISITGIGGAVNLNNAAVSDLRIMDLEFVGSSSSGDVSLPVNFVSGVSNVTVLRNKIHGTGKGLSVASGLVTGVFLQENKIYDYWRSGGSAWFGGAIRSAFLGNTIGPVPVAGSGEHGIRIQGAQNVVVSNNTFFAPNSTKSALTIRAQAHTAGAVADPSTDTQYVVVSSNKFDMSTAVGVNWIALFSPSGDTQCQWGSDIIFERNHTIYGTSASQLALNAEWSRITARNNVINASLAGAVNAGGFTVANAQKGSFGTVTITEANPGVLSYTGTDWLGNSEQFYLTTTGTLPTNLSTGVNYFVKNINTTANTFEIALTNGGASINTTGAVQTGVHTASGTCAADGTFNPLNTMPTPDSNAFYNNTFYSSTATGFNPVSIGASNALTGVTNSKIKNNLAYAPNAVTSNLPLLLGVTTGTVTSYNSTDSNGSNQIRNTSPSFSNLSGAFSTFTDFKLNVGSYAIGTTTSTILGVFRDFFNTLRQTTPSMGAWDLNPPTLTTEAASSVSDTTATGNGTITVTGGANATARGIVYGTTDSYGATTTESGSFSTGAFNAALSSLACNTLYHLASYATNSAGTAYGSDTTLTTSACPVTAPTPTVVAASGPPVGLYGTTGTYDVNPNRNFFDTKPTTTVTQETQKANQESQSTTFSPTPTFTRNLSFHARGTDVKNLQKYLNTNGYIVSKTGAGSLGQETTYFGPATYRALKRFQKDNGLPASGFLGPLTRNLIQLRP